MDNEKYVDPILLKLSVAVSYYVIMLLNHILQFLLMTVVIGMSYIILTLIIYFHWLDYTTPNGIYYIENYFFWNILKGMEQDGVLSSFRVFVHFEINCEYSVIQDTKKLTI